MIVVDANFLVLLLDPTAMPQIERGQDRVRRFLAEVSASREEVMIPAPIIAEVVAGRVERIEEVLTELRRHRAFRCPPGNPRDRATRGSVEPERLADLAGRLGVDLPAGLPF